MNIIPRIENLEPIKLIGLKQVMSLTENRTGELWGRFMAATKGTDVQLSEEKWSLQVYSDDYFKVFSPAKTFDKWAGVPVSTSDSVPPSLDQLDVAGGKYAVFDYVGSSADTRVFEYIYGEWLVASQYELDDRPHLERLGKKYKNNDPTSEEEIWIPIK